MLLPPRFVLWAFLLGSGPSFASQEDLPPAHPQGEPLSECENWLDANLTLVSAAQHRKGVWVTRKVQATEVPGSEQLPENEFYFVDRVQEGQPVVHFRDPYMRVLTEDLSRSSIRQHGVVITNVVDTLSYVMDAARLNQEHGLAPVVRLAYAGAEREESLVGVILDFGTEAEVTLRQGWEKIITPEDPVVNLQPQVRPRMVVRFLDLGQDQPLEKLLELYRIEPNSIRVDSERSLENRNMIQRRLREIFARIVVPVDQNPPGSLRSYRINGKELRQWKIPPEGPAIRAASLRSYIATVFNAQEGVEFFRFWGGSKGVQAYQIYRPGDEVWGPPPPHSRLHFKGPLPAKIVYGSIRNDGTLEYRSEYRWIEQVLRNDPLRALELELKFEYRPGSAPSDLAP